MIRQSFIILEKVSQKTENYFHSLNIKTWDDFIKTEKILGISHERKLHYNRKLIEAAHKLYTFDSKYFARLLPSKENWRLYDFFKDEAVFLDIEANGVGTDSYITIIGLFDGIETKSFVRGINLNPSLLKNELSKYKMIITFNGSTFDLPMMEKKFPDVLPREFLHWDLRHSCADVGLVGGLKMIEKELGIKRSNEIIQRVHGGDPITMWRMFKGSGDEYYLKLLIEYNEEDCINLKSIANKVYEKLSKNLVNLA